MLSYNDIYELRRERPEISEALIPYTTSVKSSVEKETGGPVQDMTPLDCFPELKCVLIISHPWSDSAPKALLR
jgi:hypothetical protein|eukprot:COSAG01_NODE_4883_length_4654_cov_4.488694_6_plen_73_part_00